MAEAGAGRHRPYGRTSPPCRARGDETKQERSTSPETELIERRAARLVKANFSIVGLTPP